uniref:Protoheme IX farnesyltransferase n=1 Tax=Buchnera aphidicola subsp. Cinara cedri (strain Cc) TaxID=372461 RepID=CYOE_BUCCC|nr:RecName: Full=Protoheme IX farnesyltransferase; AltName: Full=Heme B farnesyltransferase; AltName: Full=Heme O synthase [Buchnera aphidicola BCc]
MIKPGIILGNIICLSGGFFLALNEKLSKIFFLKTVFGLILIISSSCILNNIIDRDIDKKMNRTKNRFLCINTNVFLLKILFFFSIILLILGLLVFYIYINFLCTIISFFGFFFYVYLYSYLFKRKTYFSTFVGSVSGSLPPIIGYVAVNNCLNRCCTILFFMFSFWQIAHSYSIIIYRYSDYKLLNLPVFPILYGKLKTIIFISICILNLFFFNFLLYFFGYVKFFYFLYTSFFIFLWFIFSFLSNSRYFTIKIWSRIMFFFSIFIIFMISFLMSLNNF